MSNPASPRQFPAQTSRRQAVLGAVVLGILAVLILARGVSSAYTDYLWFSEDVGYGSVWRTVWGTKVLLGLLFSAVFGLALWVNLLLAQRSRRLTLYTPDQPGLAHLSDVLEHREGTLRLVVSVVVGLLGGTSFAGNWNEWLLFTNSTKVGIKDPQFSKDLSLYLFRLPFIGSVTSWLFAAGFVVLLFTVGVYALNGAVRLDGRVPRALPQAKAHATFLIAFLAVLRGAKYWIQRYELTLSENGYVRGASYTDVKARIPVLTLLTFVSLTVGVILILSVRRSGLTVPAVAIGMWVVVSILVGTIYPSVLQALVKSNQLDRERVYIQRNIAATSTAMGLDSISSIPLSIKSRDQATGTPELSAAEKATLQNLRIWEPSADISGKAFTKLQQNIDVYGFRDVDVDRYKINGKTVPVVVSVRELDENSNNITSWIQRRLVNTHGKGLVIASANSADAKGAPDFLSDGQASTKSFALKKPQIYFGEGTDGYAVVGTNTLEVDGKGATTTFKGDGGVPLSNPVRRFAFALRFADINMLISSQIRTNSKILFVRNIRARAEKLAPFFHYDTDPYAVLFEGRVLWVLDAYTTSNRYPYAQTAITKSLTSDSGLLRQFNYVRNPVKVVVDAYSGRMEFFHYEPNTPTPKLNKKGISSDPITRVIGSAFPRLLRSEQQLDREYPGLREHFRYPEDLFRVQSQMVGRYQVKDPGTFFQGSARWDVARAPDDKLRTDQKTTSALGDPAPSPTASMRPYYLLAALPDSEKQQFYLQSNFVPYSGDESQQTLRGMLVAPSDPAEYGKLRLYTVPTASDESGPSIVASAMGSDRRISEKENLLGQGGSSVYYGSVQVLPIANSILYVRPFFVEAGKNYPIYTYMAVWYRGVIGFGQTLTDALAEVGLSGASTSGSTPVTPGPDQVGSVAGGDAIALIDRALREAEAALQAGDLAAYQRNVNLATKLAKDAVESGSLVIGPGSADTGSTSKTSTSKTSTGKTSTSKPSSQTTPAPATSTTVGK